jgi:hypothetical protein
MMHLAQINIGRIKAPLDDPAMRGFVSRLAELNALADRSDGFVWWIPAGQIPTIDEAKRRLASLAAHGPTPFAFTLRVVFPEPAPI